MNAGVGEGGTMALNSHWAASSATHPRACLPLALALAPAVPSAWHILKRLREAQGVERWLGPVSCVVS